MHIPSLFLLTSLATTALAQIFTTTIVVEPSSASSSLVNTSTLTPTTDQATTTSTALATSISAAAAAATTSSTASDSSGDSSSDSSEPYNGGSPGSGSAVDTDAGASGSGGSGGSIGQGGLIAVIVVVAIVAIFGIASTILFVIAKRRQWNVRASIARASRRMTQGLRTPGGPRTPRPGGSSSNRRTTVNAGRLGTGGDRRDVDTPRYKRGFNVGMRELDKEKGDVLAGKGVNSTRGGEGGWAAKAWGNGWK